MEALKKELKELKQRITKTELKVVMLTRELKELKAQPKPKVEAIKTTKAKATKTHTNDTPTTSNEQFIFNFIQKGEMFIIESKDGSSKTKKAESVVNSMKAQLKNDEAIVECIKELQSKHIAKANSKVYKSKHYSQTGVQI